MLNAARPGYRSPAELGFGTQSLTVFVEDVEAHFCAQRRPAPGSSRTMHETGYGELQYGVEDLEGHHWLFSRHARNVSPLEWGASIANPR